MAAPYNLSLHSSYSSPAQHQSLQTPDASSLFSSPSLSSSNDLSQSLSDGMSSVNSLEDLLSFSGITQESNGPTKRRIDDVQTSDPKRIKLESERTHPQNHIPSILPLTTTPSLVPSILPTSKPHLPISSDLTTSTSSLINGSVVLPLLNPLSVPNPVSNSISNNDSVSNQSSIPQSTVDSGTLPQTNGGSVALLVQLYKHFQSTGDSAGMAKVHQQLLSLHSQLASKAGAYLSSLAGSATTNQLLLASINQLSSSNSNTATSSLLQTSTQLGSSSSATGLSSSISGHISRNVPNNTTTRFGTSNQLHVPFSNSSQLPITVNSSTNMDLVRSTVTAHPSNGFATNKGQVQFSANSLSSSTSGPLSKVPTSFSFSVLNSSNQPTVSFSNSLATSTSSVSKAFGSNLQLLSGNLTTTASSQSSLINPGNILFTNHSNLATQSKSVNESRSQIKPAIATTNLTTLSLDASRPLPSLSLNSTLPSAPPTNNPSIVTQSLLPPPPTTHSSTGLSPLSGLQVTAQTQANVLRAVYSYRIQRIQEFLSSLPVDQRPTTTQELRDLLAKHNILAKAFPPDMLANIQQQLPLSSSSLVPSSTTTITTTSNAAVSSSGSVLSTEGQSATTTTATNVPTSSFSSTPGPPLPGVTLETLRTLCRLPEADLIRIPMPSMLLTVVQYMRANKWNGSSADLPSLIQQAQDALAKGKLTTAVPQPPSQVNPTFSTATKTSTQLSLSTQQQQAKFSLQQQPKTTSNPSPLSQYMASVGIKVPPSVSNHTSKPMLTISKPTVTALQTSTTTTPRPLQGKSLQEQAEKDKITALQKVLQSSEEARIAFRFQAHLDKLHQQIRFHEIQKPFVTWQDVILRLLPYHVFREPELPSGAMEKADAVYEGIAGVLLSRSQGLMNQYQEMLLRDEQRQNEEDSASIVLKRLWLEGEKERKAEAERQQREAEQIAAELSVVGRGGGTDTCTSFLDSDPFLLDSDSDYPFLDQFWNEVTDGLGDINDFDLGIT